MLFKNIFHLYRGPDCRTANTEIQELIDKFASDLKTLQKKWSHVGANDTASRDCIIEYARSKL